MAISEADIKLLWGRAAGFCSRPGCTADLTRLVEGGDAYNVGEMAHVIARSIDGPRGGVAPGTDTYGNLILLCPTCHRDVDKAPDGLFPEELLHAWKAKHEARIRSLGSETRFDSLEQLQSAVSLLLAENRVTWETLGPRSPVAENTPLSNAHRVWLSRRLDRIIPNNRKISNLIRANQQLLTKSQSEAFAYFSNHADAYEDHVYDRRDDYPLFPKLFQKEFS